MCDEETRSVIEQLYGAFLSGDVEAMLAVMSDDVEIRFLGQAEVHGKAETRRFFKHASGQLADLDFRRIHTIIDGSRAAVTWTETARTRSGKAWENHGVDVFEVHDGLIVSLHENNDVRLVHEHLERYEPEIGDDHKA